MATEPSTSSGLLTADTAVLNRAGILDSVILTGDGTNAASVIIYDNASAASGTELCKIILAANATAPTGSRTEIFHSVNGVVCNAGIYMDISGTGASCVIHYRPS